MRRRVIFTIEPFFVFQDGLPRTKTYDAALFDILKVSADDLAVSILSEYNKHVHDMLELWPEITIHCIPLGIVSGTLIHVNPDIDTVKPRL